jgi:LacI family transcriptional regulator
MSVTIAELARMAGVSKTTVSRVINNKPDVDPATREKILGLIDTYQFQPNAFAVAMSQQKSRHIGLLIPHEAEYVFSNPFYTEVMRGVSTEVDAQDYYLVMCYAHEVNYLDIYKQKRVDGFVLLSPGSFHHHIIHSLTESGVPFVSTAKVFEEEGMVYVDVDNFYGATLVMEHLVGLGHRRIAFIGKPTLQSSIDRLNGYRQVLKTHNLPEDTSLELTVDRSSAERGHDFALQLLRRSDPPTAIMLANDILALGALQAAQEIGLNVPGDVSITGFDDIPFARHAYPPLTTVRQPSYEKGVAAAHMLIQLLEQKAPPASYDLPVELVIRGSTGAVPVSKIETPQPEQKGPSKQNVILSGAKDLDSSLRSE